MIHLPSLTQLALLVLAAAWVGVATWLAYSRRLAAQFFGWAMLAFLALIIMVVLAGEVALWLKGGVQ